MAGQVNANVRVGRRIAIVVQTEVQYLGAEASPQSFCPGAFDQLGLM